MKKFIDLFAGAGGLSLGFESAGLKSQLAIEQNQHSVDTYKYNSSNQNVICADIRDLDANETLKSYKIEKNSLFALIGGPPCQGFSPSNRKTRNWENPLNHLYKDYLRFFKASNPQWFVLENVPDFTAFHDGRIIRTIEKYARWRGYETKRYLLDASDFGVPQKRMRFVLIGNRIGAKLPELKATCTSKITTRMALDDLPSLENGNREDLIGYKRGHRINSFQKMMRSERNDKDLICGGTVSRNKDYVIERYRHIPPGGNLASLPPELTGTYKNAKSAHTNIYRRLIPDDVAYTIGNYRKNMMIHPWEDRGLSIREASRLQSFPDHYHFTGPIMSRQKQVGNAVPPILARAIAIAIMNETGKNNAFTTA